MMQSNIDFELAYENGKAKVSRVVNSRYFPKNILLRIWNSPYFMMPRDCIIVMAMVPKVAIILITNILDGVHTLRTRSRKD